MERKKYKIHTLKRTVLKIEVKTDCKLQKIEVMRKNGEKKKMCDLDRVVQSIWKIIGI